MRFLTAWLGGLRFQLLMMLPVGTKFSWGNWSFERGEDGLYYSRFYLNQGESEDHPPLTMRDLQGGINEQEDNQDN